MKNLAIPKNDLKIYSVNVTCERDEFLQIKNFDEFKNYVNKYTKTKIIINYSQEIKYKKVCFKIFYFIFIFVLLVLF